MMSTLLFAVVPSGPSVMLSGPRRDILIEPFGIEDEYAVFDPLTGEIIETTRGRAAAFGAAVSAIVGG